MGAYVDLMSLDVKKWGDNDSTYKRFSWYDINLLPPLIKSSYVAGRIVDIQLFN